MLHFVQTLESKKFIYEFKKKITKDGLTSGVEVEDNKHCPVVLTPSMWNPPFIIFNNN